MSKSIALFKRILGHNIFGLVLALFSMVAVFYPVLGKYAGLIAPDSMPFFSWPWRTIHFESMLAGGTFTPHNLYWLILHPLYAHELTYMFDSLVLTFGAVYYLRTQRMHPVAAWFGGLALGFCGYTFTLFSAGHRGYFHMFSCAVWAFGLIARGFETRRLVYFAMLGLVFAWGVPYQPDVLLLVGALAAVYVFWLTFSRGSAEVPQSAISNQQSAINSQKSKNNNLKSKILTVWPRFAISLVVLVLAGFSGIRSAVTTQIANRDAQIAGASNKIAQTEEAASKEKTAEERRERWLFATNWSLPPEDMLEFMVPGVFGNDSGQPPYPYWGRLGRPHDSLFQKGRMMPNYRQHTVYLGLIPLLFALFAVISRPASHGRADARPSPEDTRSATSSLSTPNSSFLTPNFSDVPFWCGVWVVCLLLAMGRYTPFYRLFYAIPYMDYIRAPVKFLHLAEIATAFLAGFGMDLFLRDEREPLRRKLLWLATGMCVLSLVGALIIMTAKPAIVRHVSSLGMAQFADALGGYAIRNFARSAALALLVAGLLWAVVGRRRSARARLTLGWCLAVLLCLDQGEVASRYVRPMDLEPLYRDNAVVKAVKKNAAGQVPNVVNYATQNAYDREWFSASLVFNGIRNLAPTAQDMGEDYGRLFRELQNDPVRLWRILGAQTVIVPIKGSQGLFKEGILQPLLSFEIGAGTVRQVQQPGEKTFVLGALPAAGKCPRLITDWQGDVPVEKQVEVLVKGKRSVSDAPMIAGGGMAAGAGRVEVLAEHGLPGELETCVAVQSECAALLVFHERPDDRQEIMVDGKPAPKYVADAVWPAALVPAGEHEIVLRRKRLLPRLFVSVFAALSVTLWALIGKVGIRIRGLGINNS